MYKSIIIVMTLLVSVAAVKAQSKNLSDFSRLSSSGNVSVTLKKGTPKAEYRIIKGDEDGLTIEVRGSELVVKTDSGYKFWKNNQTKAEVTVYYNRLEGVDCSAGSRVEGEEVIASARFEVEASSGAACSLKIETEDLTADVSSGADLTLAGKCDSGVFDASSGGSIEAYGLATRISNADVSSGARITINVSKELKADASSGGSIRYKGNPERTDLHSSVAGSIKSY